MTSWLPFRKVCDDVPDYFNIQHELAFIVDNVLFDLIEGNL